MSTTTIRLDDSLKERLGHAAAARGVSAHALILEAIADTVQAVEAEQGDLALARRRWARIEKGAGTIPLSDARAYLVNRAAGHTTPKPVGRRAAER